MSWASARTILAYVLPTLAVVAVVVVIVGGASGGSDPPRSPSQAFRDRCDPVHNPYDGQLCQDVLDAKASLQAARAVEEALVANISAADRALPDLAWEAGQLRDLLDEGPDAPAEKLQRAAAELARVESKHDAILDQQAVWLEELESARADSQAQQANYERLLHDIGG